MVSISFFLSLSHGFFWREVRGEVTTMPLVKIPSGLEVEGGFYIMCQMAVAVRRENEDGDQSVVCFASYISFLRLP